MIDLQQVTLRHGTQEVLRQASIRIHAGERVGIVGPNGAGKSTLFALITGELKPSGGSLIRPSDLRLAHVRQQTPEEARELRLLDYVADAIPELRAAAEELHAAEARVTGSTGSEREALLRRIGRLQEIFEHLGGYAIENRAAAALGGLGFPEADLARPFAAFSGGWQKRAELARALVAQADLLLLDEPSNYLDLPAVEWLQRYLREFRGTLMLISHDRYLLRSLASVTVEVYGGVVTRYPGGYDYYVGERVRRRQQAQAAAANQDRRREHIERFVERFAAKNTKATQVQSRRKMLARMERIDLPPDPPDISHLRLPSPPHCGAEVMRLENVGLTYDGTRWVLRAVDLRLDRGEKVAVVGYNGMGKTTLLRIMAGVMQPGEGRRVLGHQVEPGYQSQDFAETLSPDRSVLDIVREACPESQRRDVRSILGSFGFSGDSAEKPCGVLSGGEKIRLAFARLFVRPPNFLLLDEPTTHLDLAGRRALEAALEAYEGTVCLVSHDVEFVRNVADRVLAISGGGVRSYPGGYDYYLEKSASEAAPPAAAGPRGPTRSQAGRQERALARQERAAEVRRLKRALADAEKQIAVFETAQRDLLAQLATPPDGFSFEDANRRLQMLQSEIERRTRQWELQAQELETLAVPGDAS